MDSEQITFIKNKLIKKLSPSRYEHTLGVAYTAASLAMRYGEDMNKAFLAGLLHDCAKHLSGEKLINKCLKYNLPVSDSETNTPELLHAKVGAYYAEYKYGIDDESICHAICYHTTGCENMSLLDEIIYVADFIEPHRDKAPNLNYFRKLAFEDIHRCTYEILKATIDYVKSKSATLDTTTLKAFESISATIN